MKMCWEVIEDAPGSCVRGPLTQTSQNRIWYDWHKIMRHIYMGSVKMLKEKGMIKGIEVNPDILSPQYISYIKAKFHVILFPQ